MEAEVNVVAHCKDEDFSICFGCNTDGEGTPKSETGCISFYVDSLCQSEKANE